MVTISQTLGQFFEPLYHSLWSFSGSTNVILAPVELFPPTCKCLLHSCTYNPLLRLAGEREAPDLGEPLTHEGTLFTQLYGPLPSYTTSTYCHGISLFLLPLDYMLKWFQGCFTQYHHNFYVQDNKRTIYDAPGTQLWIKYQLDSSLISLFVNSLQIRLLWLGKYCIFQG
jgi:CxC5 like cysteine cluster associated with KDZ transposases